MFACCLSVQDVITREQYAVSKTPSYTLRCFLLCRMKTRRNKTTLRCCAMNHIHPRVPHEDSKSGPIAMGDNIVMELPLCSKVQG